MKPKHLNTAKLTLLSRKLNSGVFANFFFLLMVILRFLLSDFIRRFLLLVNQIDDRVILDLRPVFLNGLANGTGR